MAKRGRPAGLLINPEAARYVLGNRPQSWWAAQSKVSTGQISAVLAGDKGSTPEAAARMAAALGVNPGVLFPELVDFGVEVRRFTASKLIGEAA